MTSLWHIYTLGLLLGTSDLLVHSLACGGGQVWLTSNTCGESFSYNPAHPIFKIPNDFQYKIG